MTMSTSVYIREPVSPERLFRFMQSLLSGGPQDDYHRPPGQPYTRPDGSTWEPPEMDTHGQWGNRIGQGLPAIIEVEYGADGPLVVNHYDCEAEPEWCECEPGGPHIVDPLRQWEPLTVKAWFDTAYSYTAPNGAGCGDLHAFLVSSIATWLDAQPGSPGFVWSNGETDITSDTLDQIHRLGDPLRGVPPAMVSR
jgi:hypothetical protein